MTFYSEITDLILSFKIHSKEDLHKSKIKLCKKYKIDTIPSDSKILAYLPEDFSELEKGIFKGTIPYALPLTFCLWA